ncbi:hypothetical protein [Nocardia carnea]|uniref:hypothetical protein n=1 Tax=Nocardia carnea TaxID=37328 RepID=UPI0024590C1F|nr:hypothetical protein [Nocardia carnea]
MDTFHGRTEPGTAEFLDALITFHYDIGSVLLDHHGEWRRAAADTELAQGWAAVDPEVRSALLLAFAWSSRAATIAEPAGSAGATATELQRHARAFTGTPNDFHGRLFPLLPYPGPAGVLASSVGFDREDTEFSLQTALLLATATSSSMHSSSDPTPGALHIPSGADPADSQEPTTVVWPLPTSTGQHLR